MVAELTFIVCVCTAGSSAATEEITFSSLTMIGDVNLFLKGVPSDEDFEVEAEIMIAGTTVCCHNPTTDLYLIIFFSLPRIVVSASGIRLTSTSAFAIVRNRA